MRIVMKIVMKIGHKLQSISNLSGYPKISISTTLELHPISHGVKENVVRFKSALLRALPIREI